jgi:hypothetical protein
MTGSLSIGHVWITRGEDDLSDSLQRDAVMPGVEPDQRLSSRGWPVRSRVNVDGLVDGISRSRFQGILDPAFGMDMITGRLRIEADAVVFADGVLTGESAHRYCARGKQKLKERATMIVSNNV